MAELEIGPARVVLIVEDDRLISADIADAFRKAGWDVREAETAAEALSVLSAGLVITALFTDIDLDNGKNGWDVADAFRGTYPELTVAYTSGLPRDHSRAVNGSRFFIKPYHHADVISACCAASGLRPN